MTIRYWTTGTERTTGLTTGLNSLADNGIAQGSEIDNSTNLDTFAAGEIYLASLTPTGSPYVELHIAYAIDGTNYQDAPVAGGTNQDTLIRVLKVTTGAAAKRIIIPKFELLPFKFKLSLCNQTNVSFGASGNTVKLWTFNSEFV